MNTIYWTYRQFTGDEYTGQEQYGRHSITALAPLKCGAWLSLSGDKEGRIHKSFADKEEAIQFITQLNKPQYREAFGTSYELQYVESDSDKWSSVNENWKDFHHWLIEMKEYFDLPWYKKFYRKFNCFLNGRPFLNLPPQNILDGKGVMT